MADPMTREDEQRINELLTMPSALLQPEAIELRNEVRRLRAELTKRPKSRLGEQFARLSNAVGDLERERDDARAEVNRLTDRVARVHVVLAGATWRYAMVRAADVRAALTGATEGPPLAETIAAAMIAHNYPPTTWPDGPPGEGEHDRARREAAAIVRAITGVPDPAPEPGR